MVSCKGIRQSGVFVSFAIIITTSFGSISHGTSLSEHFDAATDIVSNARESSKKEETARTSHDSGPMARRMVSLGEVISACVKKGIMVSCPADDEIQKFFQGIVMQDGYFSSIPFETLPGIRSENHEALGLITSLTLPGHQQADPHQVRVFQLLEGVPADVRIEFMANLMFTNRGLVSAYTGGIEAFLPNEKIVEILNTIVVPLSDEGESANGITPMTLCGDGWCDEMICNYRELKCKSTPNRIRCYSSCGKV